MPKPRRRRLLLRLLLVALAMFVALLAALVGAELWIGGPQHLEGPAQLRYLYEADSETGFRTASDYQRVMLDGGRSIDVRLNHVGMRGPNYGAKRPGERRVLFLGDSMTFGLGLQEDETYPAQFARQASVAWTAEVSAGNAAAPSFGPRDFAPFVRRVRAAFAPDLIVASVYIGNDFFDNFAYDRAVIDGYAIDGWAARLARSRQYCGGLRSCPAEAARASARHAIASPNRSPLRERCSARAACRRAPGKSPCVTSASTSQP